MHYWKTMGVELQFNPAWAVGPSARPRCCGMLRNDLVIGKYLVHESPVKTIAIDAILLLFSDEFLRLAEKSHPPG
jgi:hypothetical protein